MTRCRAVLIDLSGTLHIGDTPTRDAVAALGRLRSANVAVRFLSNTSKESRSSLLSRLKKMNFDVREEELFTSLSAVASLVRQCKLNPLYMLSPSAMDDFPAQPKENKSHDSVVVGLAPESFNYQTMNEAFDTSTGTKRQLIVTHKARYYKEEDGHLSLGPGPFITALEEATDVKAEIVGKPTTGFFKLAIDSLPAASDESLPVAMIGDDCRQDVGEGAASLGLLRMLVKTGKFREGDEDKTGAGRPDWVGADFAAAVDHILQQ